MELHRVKEMPKDYDKNLFNRLYAKLSPYMDNLAKSMSPKYFGVTPDVIRSWFDDKFLFVYQKYHNEMSDTTLEKHLVKSLTIVRKRYLRKAYSKEGQANIAMVSLSDDEKWPRREYEAIPDEDDNGEYRNKEKLSEVLPKLKEYLSEDEMFFLKLTLNPPPAVMDDEHVTIPNEKWVEFLGLPLNEDTEDYVAEMRRDISHAVHRVKKKYDRIARKSLARL